MLETSNQYCPYCGEPINLLIDESMGDGEYVEDCQVCCRPIIVTTTWDSTELTVSLRTEND